MTSLCFRYGFTGLGLGRSQCAEVGGVALLPLLVLLALWLPGASGSRSLRSRPTRVCKRAWGCTCSLRVGSRPPPPPPLLTGTHKLSPSFVSLGVPDAAASPPTPGRGVGPSFIFMLRSAMRLPHARRVPCAFGAGGRVRWCAGKPPAAPEENPFLTAAKAVQERVQAAIPEDFVEKCRTQGEGVEPAPAPHGCVLLATFGLATVGMYILHMVSNGFGVGILGSMGASACLVFAAPAAVFSQPRNVILGHLLSALLGIGCTKLSLDYLAEWSPRWASHLRKYEGACDPLFASIAVAAATVLMQRFGIMHPPAAGTALIMASSPEAYAAGWVAAAPAAFGASVISATGLLNNLSRARKFPMYW
eukprot:TRINITY_DN9850_c0_g1_i1.p1 TRINITY_DN9850_c0_g1~~TRINITY_DN9850_c0_g1_i1.p1  ORF type:complete len:362 (+),score=54.11 TRINITY_DN9850_c0_g1_i1:354-1439(+)